MLSEEELGRLAHDRGYFRCRNETWREQQRQRHPSRKRNRIFSTGREGSVGCSRATYEKTKMERTFEQSRYQQSMDRVEESAAVFENPLKEPDQIGRLHQLIIPVEKIIESQPEAYKQLERKPLQQRQHRAVNIIQPLMNQNPIVVIKPQQNIRIQHIDPMPLPSPHSFIKSPINIQPVSPHSTIQRRPLTPNELRNVLGSLPSNGSRNIIQKH